MHVGWPQGIFITLILLGVGRSLARYGEAKKPDTYDIYDVAVSPAIIIGLLYWGGFFG